MNSDTDYLQNLISRWRVPFAVYKKHFQASIDNPSHLIHLDLLVQSEIALLQSATLRLSLPRAELTFTVGESILIIPKPVGSSLAAFNYRIVISSAMMVSFQVV